MKVRLHEPLALLLAFGLLSACGKKAEEDVVSTATEPAVQESAANATGTTTYFGDEEQAQSANN